MPVAQAIVRYAPSGRFRESVYRWGKWRSKNFVTRANGIIIAGNTLDLIQGYLYWFGVWEPNLTRFIKRRMGETPTRTFVDVGANIGYFTALVAKHYPRASVVSIEAFPTIADKLQKNIERNDLKNVRVEIVAVADVPGTIELFYAGTINEGGTTSVQGRINSQPIVVPSKPLAALLFDQEIPSIRLIKIDVEGAESRVIEGLAPKLNLLPNDAEIVVEVSAGHIDDSTYIFNTFHAHGFNAYELENIYNPRYYLYPQPTKNPKRLTAIPSKHTDVVFSKIDAEFL